VIPFLLNDLATNNRPNKLIIKRFSFQDRSKAAYFSLGATEHHATALPLA